MLRHLAGVGQVGELISSSIGLSLDALSSGAGRAVSKHDVGGRCEGLCLPVGKILSELAVLNRVQGIGGIL